MRSIGISLKKFGILFDRQVRGPVMSLRALLPCWMLDISGLSVQQAKSSGTAKMKCQMRPAASVALATLRFTDLQSKTPAFAVGRLAADSIASSQFAGPVQDGLKSAGTCTLQ